MMTDKELIHFGIPGMKWGKRSTSKKKIDKPKSHADIELGREKARQTLHMIGGITLSTYIAYKIIK